MTRQLNTILSLIIFLALTVQTEKLFADFPKTKEPVKLGIEVTQSIFPYVADIDPSGLAATAGIMVGDFILEIDDVPTWYKYQVVDQLGIKSSEKPIAIVVKRGNTIHSLTVKATKNGSKWPKTTSKASVSSCYLSPTQECIIDNMLARVNGENFVPRKYALHALNVRQLVNMGQLKQAESELLKVEELYYQLPPSENSYSNLIATLSKIKKPVKKQILQRIRSNLNSSNKDGRFNIDGYLDAVYLFGKYGYKAEASSFLLDIFNATANSPKIINTKPYKIGRALAVIQRNDLIEQYLLSKNFDSSWKSKMLSKAFEQYLNNGKIKDSEKLAEMFFTFPYGKNNDDNLVFIRMLKKAGFHNSALKLTTQLSRQVEEANPLFKPTLARALIKAYGSIGMIAEGRIIIDKYFSLNRFGPTLDLVLEATNSRTSKGLAISYYQELPELIEETKRLLGSLEKKDLKRHVLKISKFHQVLAADHNSTVDYKEFDYDFPARWLAERKILSQLLEAQKLSEALNWAESMYNKSKPLSGVHTLMVFNVYAQVAPPKQIKKLKKHNMFEKYKSEFNRTYLKRLFWNGSFEQATELFKQLNHKDKQKMTLNQIPFVSKCTQCNL